MPGSTAQVQLPANALRTATGAVPVMSLDVDAVTGFGPEFTTFPKLTKNRVDTYFGNNFSRS